MRRTEKYVNYFNEISFVKFHKVLLVSTKLSNVFYSNING